MRLLGTSFAALAVAGAFAGLAGPASAASPLRAGAGIADITPPTGYYLMGWVRSDAAAEGQHTRLHARSLVLERGRRKLALVSVDLAFVPAGLVADVVERLGPRGFGERSVVVSASHTHSGPAGFSNYPAFNTVAPTSTTPTEFELAPPADEQLYTFLVKRITAAVRRADRDREPAVAGWGETKLRGLTENRSVEAHLNEHGVEREFGEGSPQLDPLGPEHTIDPEVHVLRVDKIAGGRRVPIGIWSSFANHGTVVKPTFPYYNGDHHASAARVAEAMIRRRGGVPKDQTVVNAYGNADEGDMTAGLRFSGPAGAHAVGRREAKAFLRAWQRAAGSLDARPRLRSRWTIECFCGRQTAEGPVDDQAVVGFPFLTGSEENRGGLYDVTGVPFEGYRLPVGAGPQGVKMQAVQNLGDSFPTGVPLTVAQVADGAIVTVPAEMTSGLGRRLRIAASDALRGSGVERVAIAGLAGDFIQYLTTPEEYDRQHYEGGSTLFGRTSGLFVNERLTALLRRLVEGKPAPAPDEDKRRHGVTDDEPPFPEGAAQGNATAQPSNARRLGHPSFAWKGGPEGLDRPLDKPFVVVKRRVGGAWKARASDLGLAILWTVDDEGGYVATWEPPMDAAPGRYRFVVRANRYRLRSDSFRLRPARALWARIESHTAGRAAIELAYPEAVENEDLTWRPRRARIARGGISGGEGQVRIRVGGKTMIVKGRPGTTVTIERGALRDPHGNRNANRLVFSL